MASRPSLLEWEESFSHQVPPNFDRLGVIDREDANGYATDRGQIQESRTTPAEVIRPPIAARMIGPDNHV